MTIGRLAEITEVPASAIRYWERHGLLPVPERESGQRRYPPEAADRITVLRTFQQAGLSLEEIREFQREQPRREAVVRAKIAEIRRRMVDLDHALELLTHALGCGEEDIVECPKFRRQMARWQDADPPAPGQEAPDRSALDASVPGAAVPNQEAPDPAVPGPSAPGLSAPGLSAPGLSAPGLSAPGLVVRGPSVPDAAVPGQAALDAAVPEQEVPGQAVLDAAVPEQEAPNPVVPGPVW